MEAEGVLASFLQNRTAFLGALALNTIITWGFHTNYVSDVLSLKGQGWFLVWFDGDRAAALRAFIARRTVSEAAFYAQMLAIESQHIVAQVTPNAIVNPFCESGFRPLDEIAQELLRLSPIENA